MEKYRAIPEGYMRVGEIAKKAGVTVRTLQYYDKEGLLSPSAESEGGFRLYTDKDMVKLIQILMMKQLGFPLSEIKKRLTQLDTPDDVIRMLTEQSAQVRNKIDALTESLDAMEALSAEIAQMETVNFKKYADILLNLQMKNESYRMIKHFDDDALDIFRERIGHEKAALMAATLNDLYNHVVELLAEGIRPESEKGQTFAGVFWETLVDLSGGDIALMLKISEQMEKASSFEKTNSEERMAARHFMNRALEVFHSNQMRKHNNYEKIDMSKEHISYEETASMMDILFDLYQEAASLLAENSLPESKNGQIFARKLWETLMKFSDGEIDNIHKISQQMEEASSPNKEDSGHERAVVRNFMKQVLEIYHNNQHEGGIIKI